MKPLSILFALVLSFTTWAQNTKTDKVYLNDGTVLEVNVKKVTTSGIQYTYPGETVENEESAGNIRTIVFSSGRVQQFNTTAGSAPAAAPAAADGAAGIVYKEVQPNLLAVLPVAFYDKGSGQLWEDHSKLAQSRIYDFFEDDMSKIAPLSLQDTRNTNALLRKAAVDYSHLDEIPVDELEKILGTEYLILSKVTCEVKTKATTNQTTYGGTKKEGNRQTGAVHTTSSVNEDRTYYYVVVLEIYKGNQKLYNETRKPFLNMEDSWKDAMEYMLKRCPIYKRK